MHWVKQSSKDRGRYECREDGKKETGGGMNEGNKQC